MSEGNETGTSADLTELAKRRGFFIQSAGAYGGVSGFYTFGPQGASLKDNIENSWRDRFTRQEGNMEIDAPTVMPDASKTGSGMTVGASISMLPSWSVKRSRQEFSTLSLRLAPCGPKV